jgi:hypothetical protein
VELGWEEVIFRLRAGFGCAILSLVTECAVFEYRTSVWTILWRVSSLRSVPRRSSARILLGNTEVAVDSKNRVGYTRIRRPFQDLCGKAGANSSAGEHLPYTQGVTGSIPVSPTR